MALQKTVTTIHGFSAVNAYHRVEAISLVGKDRINFHVCSYVSPENPSFAKQIMSAEYELDGQNPIKQAYEYLKTLPEFSGAMDC
jgi:hypothetical protein